MFGGTFPPPRPFQEAAHEALRAGARAGHRCQIIQAPTGSGKTYLGMRVVNEAVKRGKRAMFLCDRKTLINQTSAVAEDYGLWDHGIIQASNPRMDLSKLFQIASVQTLMRRGWPEVDVLIVDECFPGETLVSTRSGQIRIDEVRPGTEVFTAVGPQVVRSVFSKPVFSTVKVRLSDGTAFECTHDHPIFTGMGWRPAGSLERGARLFRLQDMPGLWRGIQAVPTQHRSACGASGDGEILLDSDLLREILRQEVEEPDARPRESSEGIGDIQGAGHPAGKEVGEWERSHPNPGEDGGPPGGWLGSRVGDCHREGQGERLSNLLQGGHWASCVDGRTGTRWELPSLSKEAGAGPEEGRLSAQPWVEGVEVVEHRGGITVFNLRVSGHPSYFANGILVHNCHTLYKTWVDHITSDECKAMVVGLSATPFTKGLGKVFTNLVNAATMHDLVESGVLVPMRIFSCRRPDMAGAEVNNAGEWTERAAEERELVIVGDVVTEWHRLAEGRKTIVFGATVRHCEELCRQFLESGVQAALYTGQTSDEERAVLLEGFTPHDGPLRVLISVEALAKGFDVKDVECVCDCRPLRKSLSTAIQMWGRGLRSSPETGKTDCILRGTKIITAKGEKNIEEICLDDKIWDGESFVSHKGAICRGTKHVIHYAGLTATPEHLVKTKEGWRAFGDCASQQIRIVSTGSCGTPVRECEGHLRGNEVDWPQVEAANALPMQVHYLWSRVMGRVCRFGERCLEKLSTLQPAGEVPEVALCEGERDGSEVPESQESQLRRLWRAWNRVQVCLGIRRLPMDPIQSWAPEGMPIGSNQQRWALRTWKSALVDSASNRFSHQKESHRAPVPSISGRTSRSALRRFNPLASAWAWAHLRSDRGTVGKAILQTEGEVWDILDCGPRHCFTANGLLVHNCRLLDFSGNIIRFADDFSDVYFNGLSKLDEGEKLDKAIREDKEKEPKACPKCGFKPMGKKCISCGFEPEVKSLVESVPGQMREVEMLRSKKLAQDQSDLWAQLATYAKSHSSPEMQQKRAACLYRDIVGHWPPREWRVETAPIVEPSRATSNKIRSLYIAFAKGRGRAAA